MNYCILRAKKLSAFGSIAASAKHTFREIPTPNADASRTHLNWTSGAKTSEAVCAAVSALLPTKRRKDAVLCIEYLITASPEWFLANPKNAHRDYFNGAIAWLRQRHGADNIVGLNLQLDEKTPHLVGYIVPNTKDGRLSAKDFLGGRSKLSAMQTDFAKVVGKPVGLERGLEGSTAKHITAKKFSAALAGNPTLKPPLPPTPTIADRVTGRVKQMDAAYQAAVASYANTLSHARAEALLGKRARHDHAVELARLRAEAEALEELRGEAGRLQIENKKLRRDLVQQKAYFSEQLAAVRTLLYNATERITDLLAEIGRWKMTVVGISAKNEKLRKDISLN